MLVKLDENLGKIHAEFLQQAGYDCDRVTDEGLSGVDDDSLWRQVCLEGRFLITLDLDFSDVRKFPLGTHPGILLLRPRNNSRKAVLNILTRLLQEYSLSSFQGSLVVADEQRTRIRRPPV